MDAHSIDLRVSVESLEHLSGLLARRTLYPGLSTQCVPWSTEGTTLSRRERESECVRPVALRARLPFVCLQAVIERSANVAQLLQVMNLGASCEARVATASGAASSCRHR